VATLQSGSPNGKRRSRVGDFLAVLLLLAILAGFGWLWFRHPHSPKSTQRPDEKPPVHQVIPSLVLVERTPKAVPALPEDENTGTVATVVPVVPPAEPAKTVEPAPAPPVSNVPPTTLPPASPIPVPAAPPVPVPTAPPAPEFPRPVKNLLEAQIALAQHTISPGSIDGAVGSQTRAALATFQAVAKLACTRTLDTNTQLRLTLEQPALTDYQVTGNDLARLQPLGKTWLAKSQQSALEYETILELVAEKAHSNPALIQKLNPGIDWANVPAGAVLKIPNVIYPEPASKAAFVTIHLASRCLEAFDTASNLLAHFPCSIAAKVEKRPVGELHVAVLAPHPNYTFNPETFPESPEAQAIGRKLILPPGPNNPVGVAWIGLDKPGYGMHGTPSPEQIGRTESHGCFRLANWDAEYLLKIVYVGLPVIVEP
jgi:lipoprotein-anchoring transpeptidase ErfK/SrfK